MKMREQPSWVVDFLKLTTEGDVLPGIDLVVGLKNARGVLNSLRISFRVCRKLDEPSLIEFPKSPCKLGVSWNERQIVDRVLLPFQRPACFSGFLRSLASHLNKMADLFSAPSLPEGAADGKA